MIDNFLKLHATYENKALRILLKEFRKMSAKISFDALTKENAEAIIPFAIDEKAMQEALFKVHYTIGKSYGNLEARKLRQEIKKFKPLPLFNEAFQNFLLAYYAEFGGEEITLLTATFIIAIVEEIRKSTYENETVLQMRDRIFKTVNSPNFYKWQALRIARTETTFAMNRAKLISGEVSGLTMEKYWIAKIDSRTRDIHAYMNGKKVGQNELFDVGGEKMLHPGDRTNGASASNLVNCYLPGSIISSNIIEGQRSFYSGKAIEIVTRGGKRISITPNHKILTKNGFVAAKDINIGDNLLCNKVNTNGIVRLVNNYINKKFFTVENVFSTLQKFWSSKHFVVSSLDFDKDGESMNGNIDIVYPKIKLVNSVKPISDECINYFCFIKTFFKRIFISGFSPLNFFSGRNQTTSTRFMSFLYLAFPSCFIHFRPLKNFALGLGSTINPQRFKLSGERNSGDTEFLFQLIKTHSRIIEFDDVVDVRNFTYVGHVYDFTSYSGTNIVNNIYTSNCRCTFGYRAKRDSNGQLIWNDDEPIKPNSNYEYKLSQHPGLKEYCEENDIKLDENFLNLFDDNIKIKITRNAEEGTACFYAENRVNISPKIRRGKEKIIYHELGHALDNYHNLWLDDEVDSLMKKYKNKWKSDGYKELIILDNKWKIENETLTKRMLNKEDIGDEKVYVSAFADTLMSIHQGVGAGHDKSYFKDKRNRNAEFIAHSFENKYIGNPYFEKVAPELYNDMINLVESLIIKHKL